MGVRTNWKWIVIYIVGLIVLLSIIGMPTILIMWALDMVKFKLITIPILILLFSGWIVSGIVDTLTPEEYREFFNKDKQ